MNPGVWLPFNGCGWVVGYEQRVEKGIFIRRAACVTDQWMSQGRSAGTSGWDNNMARYNEFHQQFLQGGRHA